MGILGALALLLWYVFLVIFGILTLGFVFGCLVNAMFTPSDKDDNDS